MLVIELLIPAETLQALKEHKPFKINPLKTRIKKRN